MNTMDYVITFDDARCLDAGTAGVKASTLARLAGAGFSVPEGVVLITDAFIASADARMPEAIERALIAVAATFGNTKLAVRSSSSAEDTAEQSFAGQYDSVLGVRGAEELVGAVRKVWQSAESQRVEAYRAGEQTAPMAVLIQRMVDATAAGVAFTADPVSGDRSSTLVEGVRGLGDALVAGEVTPDQWMVTADGDAHRSSGDGHALSANEAADVARLARAVAAMEGSPQDIEWAIGADGLWLLQARPITTLAREDIELVPVTVDVPQGYWEREASHLPTPHSPLNRSIFFEPRTRGMRALFAEVGALAEELEFREIGGWEYMRLVPPGGKDRPAPPGWLLAILARTVPALRARARQAEAGLGRLRSGEWVDRWFNEWRPELRRKIVRLRGTELESLSDADLDRHFRATVALAGLGAERHFRLAAVCPITCYELVTACEDLLGWEESEALTLLAGLSTTSTEPARALTAVAEVAAKNPALLPTIDRPGPDVWECIARTSPEFRAAFDEFVRTWGCRALRYEVADPTLGEQPLTILGLVRDQLHSEVDAAGSADELRRSAEVRAEAALDPRSWERFRTVLDCAQRSHPVREDNELYTFGIPLALIRFAALEVGRRLAARQQLSKPEDIFFLEAPEIPAALGDGQDRQELVRRRKGERAWVLAHPGPASYGQPPSPPPSLKWLPQALRIVNEGVPWAIARIFEAGLSQQHGGRAGHIKGVAASPGNYTGVVRVVHSEDDFSKLRAGDVMVCPITTSTWSVLFSSIGALVTDFGGILSHPAIIAREFRLPAVVATGNATAHLRDGQHVTVDGTAGVVTVL